MIKIKKKGRHAYFSTPINGSLENTISNRLSYTKKGAEFMPNPYWANVCFYKKRTRSFPYGLINFVIPILESWCKATGDTYKIESHDILETTKLNPKLREYQKKAISALNNSGGGIIHLPTGAGKTFTAVEYLNQYDKDTKVLIVVPTLDLKTQWTEQNIVPKTDVKTYQSIKDFKQLENYDIVVFDECHHLPATSLFKIAMKCHNAIMVGLSATPYRDDGEEMRMFAALGSIVYSITIKDLIQQGHLVDAEINVLELKHETPDIFNEYHDIVNINVVNNEYRNKLIIKMAEDAPKPCLILVDKIEHGNLLSDTLSVPFIHGNIKSREIELENLKQGMYPICIASKIYNEGVDVPCLRSLILAAGGKSSIKIVQQIGRVLRPFEGKTKAHIYDVFDSIKYLKQHSKQRQRLYEENFDIKWIKESDLKSI